ncbi:MAG TPA: hypothetical protein VLW44_11430 [Streptosporangiaceae bacterium]|nr:hypothetical protein [Streptosporangiaceae bacterium]
MPPKVFLTAATLAAGLTLAACGSGSGAGSSSGAGPAASPAASCLQQYRTWDLGPAHAAGENLVAELNGIQAASAALNNSTTAAALKRAGTAAQALARYPIPKCADPKGYWRAVLVKIQAAANADPSGQGALIAAAVVLHDMPGLDRQLATELTQTVPGLSKQKSG